MSGPTSPFWRAVRAAVCAVATGYLAALGHLVGGAGLPDAATLLLVALTVGLVVSGLARRRGSLPAVAAVVVGAQVAFHAVFWLTGHSHAAGGPLPTDAAGDPVRMVVCHLLAAAATVAVLYGGEDALFRLFAALRRALPGRPAAAGPVPVGIAWSIRAADRSFAPLRTVLVRSDGRRGPPGWPRTASS